MSSHTTLAIMALFVAIAAAGFIFWIAWEAAKDRQHRQTRR
jgi:predicted permease